ncbi:hypothetical protein HNO88_004515 [Novosphingobium chloroacetimidivorans]|uniref:Uncharacterized protein n=1 Tax=Novosphingobium chloroacetimidivorans TaxID=1428314 RepID=A0A7W7KE39_9SPHN|nr:hypothetical protein [Novosphingobium chloroacetimidivorans]MBB4861161.1 hypothetical protein [Novosphingobium chloroacetimidivorans]
MQNLPVGSLVIGKEAIITGLGGFEASVQGLWAFVATSALKPRDLSHRGTLALQAGRILGGHAQRAYAGTYRTNGHVISLRIETWLWNPLADSSSLFGVGPGSPDVYHYEAEVDPVFMSGEMTSQAAPGLKLTAALMKICDLDGAY